MALPCGDQRRPRGRVATGWLAFLCHLPSTLQPVRSVTNRTPRAKSPSPTVAHAGALGSDIDLRLAVWLADVSAETASELPRLVQAREESRASETNRIGIHRR